MKYSIHIRLAIAVGVAIVIFASSTRASLEELLAPLPFDDAPVAKAVVAKPDAFASEKAAVFEPELPFDGILASDLQQSIEEALQWTLRPNGSLTLVPLRELPDLSAHARPFQVNLINAPGRLSRNNMLLRFQVENETGVVGEWTVPFKAHLYSEVWFARARLQSGDLASASDLEAREVDMLVEPDAVPANFEVLLRHEYSRDVVPGQPLSWKDLQERSLVRKGTIIEVSAVQGLLSISMRAVARQDGGQGEIILLRNIDSSKEFSARVVGENRAEIIF